MNSTRSSISCKDDSVGLGGVDRISEDVPCFVSEQRRLQRRHRRRRVRISIKWQDLNKNV